MHSIEQLEHGRWTRVQRWRSTERLYAFGEYPARYPVPSLLTDPCETGPCDIDYDGVVIWETVRSDDESPDKYRYLYLACSENVMHLLNVWY